MGCVVAQQAAARGLKVLLVEKRSHIAGNCFDEPHAAGFHIHRYGPHYFRTDREDIFQYLSRFTEWCEGTYRAESSVADKFIPFPLSLGSLEAFFGRSFDEISAKEFIKSQTVPIAEPKNAEEYLLATVGPQIYEAFFKGYTEKQWGRAAHLLDSSVVARVPIFFDRDTRYSRSRNQKLPENGYTAMFTKMISDPNIEVRLETDFFEIRENIIPKVATLYTGPLDRYFDYRLGRLPWRSLRFEFTTTKSRNVQHVGQINYPDSRPYTRTVEFNHLYQRFGEETVVSTEFPSAEGDPYYPVPSAENTSLLNSYLALAEKETELHRVFFEGRLARYVYINIDQAIGLALDVSTRIFEDSQQF